MYFFISEQNDHEKDISIIDFIRLTKYFGPFARESDGSFQCLNTVIFESKLPYAKL